MGDQKDCRQETSGKGLRTQGALEGYMAAQERIRHAKRLLQESEARQRSQRGKRATPAHADRDL